MNRNVGTNDNKIYDTHKLMYQMWTIILDRISSVLRKTNGLSVDSEN